MSSIFSRRLFRAEDWLGSFSCLVGVEAEGNETTREFKVICCFPISSCRLTMELSMVEIAFRMVSECTVCYFFPSLFLLIDLPFWRVYRIDLAACYFQSLIF